MSTHQYKRPKSDPIEQRVVLAVMRGLWWLVSWPFRGLFKGSAPRSRRGGALDTQEVGKRWADIQTSVGLGGITHFGSAVVAADKLVDYVLRQKGYAGETMGDRLKSAKDALTDTTYNNLWQAHKLRNHLVHDLEGQVLSFQVKDAMAAYEQALREMGALK